jgi:hypothetical protein
MVDLIVVVEGQTEETFVRDVLALPLALNDVFATSRMIETSPGHRGGGLNFDRVKRFLRNTLRERADTYVTTLFDLYALGPTFRGVSDAKGLPPSDRSRHIESLLHEDIAQFAQCRPERFLPHIQPHEFESLLFSDVSSLCQVEPDWHIHHDHLLGIRASVENPEWINDSPQTAPSKRLEILKPTYRKSRHGPDCAARIGLERIKEECPHFNQWFNRIVALGPL